MPKKPINWWRVAAGAFGVLFLYTTWEYAETAATLAHLRGHMRLMAVHAAQAGAGVSTNANTNVSP